KEKWNPRIKPYLYGSQRGIYIFDLVKTKEHLEKVVAEVKKLYSEGKTILFVSTKQQSIAPVEAIGQSLNQPVVTKKWIPGLLTNWSTIKRRIKYYLDLQQSFQTGEIEKYKKKEQLMQRKKLAKLDTALSGVADMTELPDAIFVIDAVRDNVAVREAHKKGIPLYGICDTNANPDDFTEFIPANDDAVTSLNAILDTLESELKGASTKSKKKKEEVLAA
ncbi:MAG: 30S ribosomal protein S2, partial [Candidatus Peribacteraceae bacterium]|nr:30S ribosomal protein S2 [Candidatus Peribacteraceae bacterium]